MTVATARELDELRGRVDRIDEAIVELLGERLSVVTEIARAKRRAPGEGGGGLALRPAREAQVVRRLVARGSAAGPFPRPTLVRLWRELFAAMTRVQSAAFAVCVHVPPHQPELWDIARDHFGSLTPLHRAESPGHALRLAGAGGHVVAVLPLPTEADRWWTALTDASPEAPRVVARLPFAALPGYPEGVGGLVVAALALEPTGDDLTLVAVETDGTVSSARIRDLLAPLRPRLLTSHRDPGPGGPARHLVEIDGYHAAAVAGLGEAGVGWSLAPLGERLLRVVTAGCYARPLAAADLA